MNFNYGNNNYNFFNNYNMNNTINHPNNFNPNQTLGINNFNNNPMQILLQYINILNSNKFNHIPNPSPQNSNFFQLMPNIIKYGFNQPYSFENTKKEPKIIHPSNFKSKLYFKNKTNDNLNNINNNEDSIERKFMRKMTKAEKIEIDKWFEARKKLYPTKKNIELKKQIGQIKVEKGLVSDLELKLRKKVNILKKLNTSKKIKIRNKFNKEFPNFQKRKKEFLEKKQQDKKEENNINNTNQSNIENKQIDNDKEDILEDGEIQEEILSKKNEEENNNKNNEENNNDNNINLIGKKRERKSNNIKKKLGKNKKEIKEKKNEYGFKKGFKYKSNNLYDELIKKDKIKEQNILLQAIRYLINLKEE